MSKRPEARHLPLPGTKTVQKKFIYANERIAKACESALADDATIRQRTVSQLIEECIVDRYFPGSTRQKAHLANTYLNGTREEIMSLLDEEANSVDFESQHRSNLPLLDALLSILPDKGVPIEPSDYLRGKLDSMACAIDAAAQKEPDPLRQRELSDEAALAKTLADEMAKGRRHPPRVVLSFLKRNWETLGSLQVTYRFLVVAIEGMEPWEDTAYDRATLAEAIDRLVPSWEEEERKK